MSTSNKGLLNIFLILVVGAGIVSAASVVHRLSPDDLTDNDLTFRIITAPTESEGKEGSTAFAISVWSKGLRLVPVTLRTLSEEEKYLLRENCLTGDTTRYHLSTVAHVGFGNEMGVQSARAIFGTCFGDTVVYQFEASPAEIDSGRFQMMVQPPFPPEKPAMPSADVYQLRLKDFVEDR